MARRSAGGFAESNATISPTRTPRSSFNLSFEHTTTIDSATLYPVYVEETLPGDTFNIKPSFFVRMATPLKPYISGIKLDWQAFWTPNRLVWTNFVKMMGERENPDDHNDYTVPQVQGLAADMVTGSMADYFGINVNEVTGQASMNALPFRCVNLIWNEWYRDENLQDPLFVYKDDGPELHSTYTLPKRNKRKDYLSGALPFAQKGLAVEIPVGQSAPLGGSPRIQATAAPTFGVVGGNPIVGGFTNNTQGTDVAVHWEGSSDTAGQTLNWDNPGLKIFLDQTAPNSDAPFADLSSATGININELRQLITLQQLFERDARGGTRYRETVMSHFGVQTDDVRLMRPQLLATGSMDIAPKAVPSTFSSDQAGTPEQGELAAYAVGSSSSKGFTFSSTEHGWIHIMCSVRTELQYQQGQERKFNRKTRFDYYWPDLAPLGEQAIESREIFMNGTGNAEDLTDDYEVWGYSPRYDEYRTRRNIVSGKMRSSDPQSLDIWHTALDFATRPALNSAFVEENPPISRIIAVPSEPEFILDSYFKVTAARPIPRFGTPGLTRF